MLRGILDNDQTVLRGIYRDGFAVVERFVKKNMGTTEDARNLFQERIVRGSQRGGDWLLKVGRTPYFEEMGIGNI